MEKFCVLVVEDDKEIRDGLGIYLKNQGYKVNLKVFDTERSAEKMYTMVDEIDRFHPDLIIGPVYGSVYKALMDDLTNKNIPVIYPLSSSNFLDFFPANIASFSYSVFFLLLAPFSI